MGDRLNGGRRRRSVSQTEKIILASRFTLIVSYIQRAIATLAISKLLIWNQRAEDPQAERDRIHGHHHLDETLLFSTVVVCTPFVLHSVLYPPQCYCTISNRTETRSSDVQCLLVFEPLVVKAFLHGTFLCLPTGALTFHCQRQQWFKNLF